MFSALGHHSRFEWPCRTGHLPALLSSVFASMFLSTRVSAFFKTSLCTSFAPGAPIFPTLLLNPFDQVKLTLVIAAIRYIDEPSNAAAASLFRCAGASWSLRTRGGSVRDHAAGFVDADQGTGGDPGRRARRKRRATNPAYQIRRRGRAAHPRHPALGR